MVDLNKYINLYVEKEEVVVLYLGHSRLWAGLSGDERPRSSHALPVVQVEDEWDTVLERVLRDAVYRGVMVAVSERKCVFCVDYGATEQCRAAVARVMFEKLKCPALLLLEGASSVCVASGLDEHTALLLHCTARELFVLPVLGSSVRTAAVQLLRLDDPDGNTWADVALRAVQRCPLDTRLALVSRVIVAVDGAAMPQDFEATFKVLRFVDAACCALIHLVQALLGEALGPHLQLLSSPFTAPLPWVGASMVGATLKLAARTDVLQREQYVAGKRFAQLGEIQP